jgi:hypothetical protein
MKATVPKASFTSLLVSKLFSSGTLRRGVDSWLVFNLTRMSSPGLGRDK